MIMRRNLKLFLCQKFKVSFFLDILIVIVYFVQWLIWIKILEGKRERCNFSLRHRFQYKKVIFNVL